MPPGRLFAYGILVLSNVNLSETWMRSKCVLTILGVLLLVLAGNTDSGELTPDLAQLVESKQSGEIIKVWIKLHPAGSNHQLKAALSTQATTRTERHRLVIDHFKTEHALAQKPLLERLNELKTLDKVKATHAYWIVNVIEAEIVAGELPALAAWPDVEIIQTVPTIHLIKPEPATALSSSAISGATDNLIHIKARQAWAAGYTGAGRLVCSFDTGVEGSHDALCNKWKGLDGDSAAAWFDPILDEPFPHTQPVDPNHGTHVMGIMVGHYGADTTGVAPGARWISAAVIDVGSTAILRAFEWAADPDGNPNTMDDVPDVINHSWGFDRNNWKIVCEDIFFEAIDHIETLGIVNIFAAGNAGSAAYSITNPANRAEDSLDCFAVGNLNATVTPPILTSSSSRGPSSCPDTYGAIKPNVVAPGTGISSSKSANSYGLMSGTSMAAPHVSGLVTLLRQKNPNATVDEIKEAIRSSATGNPTWGTLPDSNYGWGQIDCMAALNTLAGPEGVTSVRVYDFIHASISPGDTVEGTLVLQCLGDAVIDVSVSITGSHPSLTVLNGSANFGNIARGDTAHSSDTIRVVVSDTVTESRILSVDLEITGNGFTIPAQLHFLVDPPATKSVITHNTGRIQFSISNFGLYGMGPGSYPVWGPGVGFTFDGGSNELFEAGLMIGTGYTQVSSAVHTYIYEPDNDFRVAPGGNMQFLAPGPLTAEQTFCIFNDENASDPLGVEITQESFADNGSNNDFVILRYILRNYSVSNLDSVHIGLYLNWDAGGYYAENIGAYETDDSLIWVAYYRGGNPTHYRGMKLIQGPLATALTETESNLIAIPLEGGDGFEMWEKYQALTHGFSSADTYRNTPSTLFQLMAAGPISLPTGGIDTVAFAILAGSTLADISDAAVRAQSVLTNMPLPPLLFSVSDKTATVGDTLTFEVEAVDPNGTTPSLMAQSLPSGAVFTDNGDGTGDFYWPIGPEQQGLYEVMFIASDGTLTDSITVHIAVSAACQPITFALHQNYPNPFNSSTVIPFDLQPGLEYKLSIYNTLGQLVHQESGKAKTDHVSITWYAASVTSGVYFYKVTAGGISATRKMMFLK